MVKQWTHYFKFKSLKPTTTGTGKESTVNIDRNGIAVVKQLTHHSKLNGSKPTTNGTGKESPVKIDRNSSAMVKTIDSSF